MLAVKLELISMGQFSLAFRAAISVALGSISVKTSSTSRSLGAVRARINPQTPQPPPRSRTRTCLDEIPNVCLELISACQTLVAAPKKLGEFSGSKCTVGVVSSLRGATSSCPSHETTWTVVGSSLASALMVWLFLEERQLGLSCEIKKMKKQIADEKLNRR